MESLWSEIHRDTCNSNFSKKQIFSLLICTVIFLICVIICFNSYYQGVLRIKTFIHTDTQDSTTVPDAPFLRYIYFLSHFIRTWKRNMINRIYTVNGLWFILVWIGGMKNVMDHAAGPVVIPQLIKWIPIIWLVKFFYIYLFFYTNLSVAKYWWYISVQG